MKKNIYLQITPFFPTAERFYGPYIYDQVKAIERNSPYEVIVIKIHSFYNHLPEVSYVYQGVRVYNFKVFDLPSSTFPGIFHFINRIRFEHFLKNTVGIKPESLAFIHAHSVYPGGALAVDIGKKYNVPALIQHHGFDIFQTMNVRLLKGMVKKLNMNYMKKFFLEILNQADLNIGVSQKVLDRFTKDPNYENKKTYVLYNGVDTKKFHKLPKKKKDKEAFTIGCIGNFFEIKDHITLLKAVSRLKKRGLQNFVVRLIGSGPTMPICQEYIRKHSLENIVFFENEVDHTLLNEFYNTLDLFVLPSYYEAFGCVYAEAMQTGVPIIAVKGQGIEEVLKDEDRKYSLIAKGDDQHLADLIEFRYNHKGQVDYNFDIDLLIQEFLNYLKTTFSGE